MKRSHQRTGVDGTMDANETNSETKPEECHDITIAEFVTRGTEINDVLNQRLSDAREELEEAAKYLATLNMQMDFLQDTLLPDLHHASIDTSTYERMFSRMKRNTVDAYSSLRDCDVSVAESEHWKKNFLSLVNRTNDTSLREIRHLSCARLSAIREKRTEIKLLEEKYTSPKSNYARHRIDDPAIRQKVWDLTDGRCVYCDVQTMRDLEDKHAPNAFRVDHYNPKVSGGCDHFTNYVPCCNSCNGHKSDKHPVEFIKSLRARFSVVLNEEDAA